MSGRLHLSLALLSVALIAFQLVLMQVLSYSQWYHFAYMIISVAMLGFGFSGTILAVFREWFLDRYDTLVSLLMLLCGLTMASVVVTSQMVAGGFDMYLLFIDSSQVPLLATTYLLYMIPFFLGALAIGLIFVKNIESIGKIYFSNLAGSGVGGLVAIAAMWIFFPQQLPGVLALIPVIAALLIIPRKYLAGMSILAFIITVLSLYIIIYPPAIHTSEFKSISRTMNLPGAVVEKEYSSPYGLVQTVASEALRHAPGLSLAYRGEIPVRKAIFNNGDWFGPLVAWSGGDSVHLMDYTTKALPYLTGTRERVLILNAATGVDVSHAVSRDAGDVIAVEPNLPVVRLLKNEYAGEIESLFQHPAVSVFAVEPRTYLSTTDQLYDLILLPTVETFGGTAGLYAMQEQYILTTESFREMWHRLNPGGAISVTSWMDYPVKNPLKLLATFVELLESEGITDPRNHLVAVRSWGTVTFLLQKGRVTGESVSAIRDFCRRMYFDPVILPDLEPGERTRFNDIDDRSFFTYVDEILYSNRERLYDSYGFNLRPSNDNRPYFSQFLRWESLPHVRRLFGDQAMPFLEVGYLIVAVTFIQIFIAAVVLILLPLFRIGFRGEGRLWTVVYFGGLGLGFMFFEIVLIQRFILYLGQPVYSAAAVITALLICSGMGSYVSSRFHAKKQTLCLITGTVAGSILLYIMLLPMLLGWTMGLPLTTKALLSFLIIAPPAFFMGIPFPLGLRHVSAVSSQLVPWAWGINGIMSVVSTVLATIVAVEFGFTAVMFCAAAGYGIALAVSTTGK
jgi:hypothetical protein